MNDEKTVPQGFGSGSVTDAPTEQAAPAPETDNKGGK